MALHDLKILILCGKSRSSRIVYHSLKAEVKILKVIQEDKISSLKLIRGRSRRIGPIKTTGQVLFIAFNRFTSKLSKAKITALMDRLGLSDQEIPQAVIERVPDINSQRTIDLIKELKPDVVVVNGTRIIKKEVLASTSAVFINTHMGITPRYRGVHGGYWALASGDAENCGVTVHLVDEGIDTGGVLYQARIEPGPSDNFNTYPLHQIAAAIPLLKAALQDIQAGRLQTTAGVLPSKLWYHPTLAEYLGNWIRRRVK